jgi:S-DNA-T family DNA segregation ATPase FtsK/SpoIIIE
MMAIWAGSLGPVGHGFSLFCALVIGWVRELVPLLALVGGIMAVRAHYRSRRALSTNSSVRAAALVLVLWALCGLGDVAAGSPGPGAKSHAIEQAGGYLGALIGAGLHAAIGSPGAVVVLLGCVLLGSVLAAATSVGQAVRYAWLGASWVWSLCLSGASRVVSRVGRIGGMASSSPLGQVDNDSSQLRGDPSHEVVLGESSLFHNGDEWHASTGSLLDSGPDTQELILGNSTSREEPFSGFATVDGPTAAGSRAAGPIAESPIADDLTEDSGDDGDPSEQSEAVSSQTETSQGGSRTRAAASRSWKRPEVALLGRGAMRKQDPRAVEDLGHRLVSALASHGVATRLVGQSVGPTVTRYELELAPGVKVARVTSLSKDIAYALASPDVRILAPIPGKSAIGIEVPNVSRQVVTLGDVLSSREAKAAKGPMQVPLGCDVSGRVAVVDLTEMPHLLISGATGSGKSSCINSLLVSLLLRATPEEVRMVLIDPKRVELSAYEGLPHLLTPVVVDPKRAAQALAWAVREMERRYRVLAAVGARDIRSYSRSMQEARQALRTPAGEVPEGFEAMPYVLVVVDELHDLMMVAARDVEDYVCRLAQMARAVGIHLILATQRPSVDVITGVIKANIPSRLAFAVSSLADSRVILDQPGAERLVGKGDMLLVTASSSVPIRLQGPWVEEAEVRRVTAFWRRQGAAGGEMQLGEIPDTRKPDSNEEDELLDEAMALVVKSQLGSTSMLQRKLRVGFARAGRLMDLLERKGVVGPSEGSKARAVLMTPDELPEQLRGDPS